MDRAPTSRLKNTLIDAGAWAMVIALPLAGALAVGRPAEEFFQFPPPLEIPRDYLEFSWVAAMAVGLCLAVLVLPWCRLRSSPVPPSDVRGRSFPVWGFFAVAWTVMWWAVAWTRWSWFAAVQPYTFFPLWLGFIVSANALAEWRSGSCLMRRAPGRWGALFGASALCWWTFEWLNRFVENWHYLGAERFGALSYALHASACFSTVLPAVAAVAELLETSARWRHRVGHGPRWTVLENRWCGAVLGGAGAGALLATGVWPRLFYPALWVAPLAMLLAGRPSVVRGVAKGDWARVASWMMASAVCGFFWEMWNFYSAPRWIYTVPGVERWWVFEMPLLGFAGYLPFGVECLLVAERVLRFDRPAPTHP